MTQRFDRNPDQDIYLGAVGNSQTHLHTDDVSVFTKVNAGIVQVIVIEDKEVDEDGPWYAYLKAPISMISGVLDVIPSGITIPQAFSLKIPWLLEGMVTSEETRNLEVAYSMSRKDAVDLFGEDWEEW